MPDRVKCPKCGAMQSPGPSCASCGAPLGELAPPPSPSPTLRTAEAPSPSPDQPRQRLSWMAVLSLLSAGAQWPVLLFIDYALGITPDPMDQWIARETPERLLALAALIWPVATVVLGLVAASRIKRSREQLGGLALARLGVVLGITVLLFQQIALPRLPLYVAATRSRFDRAMREVKTAVQQAIQYGKDKGAYPTSLKVLRDSGYGNVPDKDPWGTDYVLSPNLRAGAVPSATDDVYVYSRGRCGTGTYTPRLSERTGECAAGGFSSLDGAFSSWKKKGKP